MSLDVQKLCFSYGERQILKELSFHIQTGNLVCLIGPNGVGKSTLFKTIMRMLPNYQGQICIDGQDTQGLSIEKMAKLVSYIPQSHTPTFSYSVFDMVLMGTTSTTSVIGKPGKKQRQLTLEVLEQLGISYLKDRSYTQISGGERQLTLIARALVQQTKFLIMDEPTANLDYGNQIRVLEQIKNLTQKGYTIFQATHQPDQAFLFADEVLAMKEGKVLAQGKPKDVITKDFIHELYDVEVEVQSIFDDKMRVCVPITALKR
jgi:iron complex transport system ATP-binding protein